MAVPDDRSVSVCMIAYNHGRYIAQALDSVLGQETSFPVEIIVGEDCSEDSTRQILVEYSERFPGRIRPLLADRNRGMMVNFLSTLAACRGRYVAVCEADDYWLGTSKLQKQVDYLESHPGCSVSFHNAYMEENGQRRLFHQGLRGEAFGGPDLLKRWLIPTASAVFRNPGFSAFPDFFYSATHGDLLLFLLLAERGSLDYLDEVMSVYRLHPGGVTTSFAGTDFNRRQIDFLRRLDAHFEHKYRDPLMRRVAALHRSNAVHSIAGGRRGEAAEELRLSWGASPVPGYRALRESLQVLMGLVSPSAYSALRSATRRLRGSSDRRPPR